jgi:hypothetical protein
MHAHEHPFNRFSRSITPTYKVRHGRVSDQEGALGSATACVRDLAGALLAAICVLFAVPRAIAGTWTEQGDAGQLCSTAQVTTGTGTLDQIIGSVSSIQDVDLYRIRINDPATFSASTTACSPASARRARDQVETLPLLL